ncbi:MAG: sugar phosphate isomerase/epimerase [Deltaproteobacteria bacterium]|nr:sugar phosphate isomerase/epimerase [Deltaproteobacteria bacterium]
MRLSFSANAFVKRPVFEAVERIAAVGYDSVELLADVPHLYADSVSDADLEKMRAVLNKTGLKVANINANTAVGFYGRTFWEPLFEPSLAHPDPDLRQWRIEYSKKCVDIAASLGAPTVSVTSGRPIAGILPEESMTLLRCSLREVLKYAAEKSVRIGIEYEPGLLIERSEELVELISVIDSPWLGANLDLGHSHVLGEDPETVISGLGPRIFHVHIEDIKGVKHYHLIPGTGDMDFPKLFALLKRHGYDGFVTVELYTYPDRPEQAATEALEYLRNIPA